MYKKQITIKVVLFLIRTTMVNPYIVTDLS